MRFLKLPALSMAFPTSLQYYDMSLEVEVQAMTCWVPPSRPANNFYFCLLMYIENNFQHAEPTKAYLEGNNYRKKASRRIHKINNIPTYRLRVQVHMPFW